LAAAVLMTVVLAAAGLAAVIVLANTGMAGTINNAAAHLMIFDFNMVIGLLYPSWGRPKRRCLGWSLYRTTTPPVCKKNTAPLHDIGCGPLEWNVASADNITLGRCRTHL
jgi:hypothetical protein